jgi:phosphohistidine phosphatase
MDMELLLVRHGVAHPAAAGEPDSRRALTAEGRARMRRAVDGLRALDLRCTRLLHSPWTRAAQTAELLAPLVDGPLVPCSALARAPDAALLALLAERAPRVALVGHQPWLTELLLLLVSGAPSPAARVRLGKGGVAWLAGTPEPGGMELLALFPPRSLRRLGRR